MLALTRKKGESIMIGDNAEVVLLGIQGDQVKLGIIAPKSLLIYRKELYEQIQQENKLASSHINLTALRGFKKGGVEIQQDSTKASAWVVDRFEDGIAVLERMDSQESKQLSRDLLPKSATEGSVLIEKADGWEHDTSATDVRAQQIKERFDRLKKRG